jgi:hypothetical protein
MRYVLDEDVNPEAAVVARGLGLDVISAHEVGRRGLSDPEQLDLAFAEGRALVTRNRDDFLRLARTAYASGRSCAGILVVPATVPNRDGPRMAHALKRWDEHHANTPPTDFFDYLR